MTEAALLKQLRRICLALPEASETVKWGHPTFVAGRKMFAALDAYGGRPCISFRAATPLRQAELIQDPRFYAAPYAASYGWVCMHADRPVDWQELAGLLRASYRAVALQRMLTALDDAPRKPRPRRKTRRGA